MEEQVLIKTTTPMRLQMPLAKAGIALLLFLCTVLPVCGQLKPALADSMLNFIQTNRNKAALYITRNDTAIASLNENRRMPLASTVKIIVAIEFARQSARETINENAYIALPELDKFYVPGTDGGAHSAWIDYARKNNEIRGDSVKLVDVARGMIIFSSNANTEYLMDLLGFDNVNNVLSQFDAKEHSVIFPLVGSLFLYQVPKKTSESKLAKTISGYSDKKYGLEAYGHHLGMKEDSGYRNRFRPEEFSLALQKIWSDRLPASTAKEYALLVQSLNKREVLEEPAYFTIAEVLEFPMENKVFQSVFKHYGVKGGSTGFVLTHVLYFTMKNGTRMELAIFFNDLTPEEEQKLEGWLDPFEAQVIFDPKFREKVKF